MGEVFGVHVGGGVEPGGHRGVGSEERRIALDQLAHHGDRRLGDLGGVAGVDAGVFAHEFLHRQQRGPAGQRVIADVEQAARRQVTPDCRGHL